MRKGRAWSAALLVIAVWGVTFPVYSVASGELFADLDAFAEIQDALGKTVITDAENYRTLVLRRDAGLLEARRKFESIFETTGLVRPTVEQAWHITGVANFPSRNLIQQFALEKLAQARESGGAACADVHKAVRLLFATLGPGRHPPLGIETENAVLYLNFVLFRSYGNFPCARELEDESAAFRTVRDRTEPAMVRFIQEKGKSITYFGESGSGPLRSYSVERPGIEPKDLPQDALVFITSTDPVHGSMKMTWGGLRKLGREEDPAVTQKKWSIRWKSL